MTTQQLQLTQPSQAQSANGMAIFFFLLGAPSIYSALRQRSLLSVFSKGPVWGLGLGIIAFTLAGTWTCLQAMA